jgi:hypothetical protein
MCSLSMCGLRTCLTFCHREMLDLGSAGFLCLGHRRGRLTATMTATADSHGRTWATVYLGTSAAIRVVVTPEKWKVGGSTPPLPII